MKTNYSNLSYLINYITCLQFLNIIITSFYEYNWNIDLYINNEIINYKIITSQVIYIFIIIIIY